MASLLSLPNEILLEISSFQSIADQNSFRQTNQRLAYLLRDIPINTVFRTQHKIYGLKALYFFASQNSITRVQALLDRGILSFIESSDNIINGAVEQYTEATLGTLLECGISGDLPDECGWRPLIVAIVVRRVEMIRVLLSEEKYGVNVNASLEECGTPLMIATKVGFQEGVSMLLQSSKIEVNATEPGGWSSLQISINKGEIGIMKLLLSDPRVDVSTRNGTSPTPLICAVKSGNTDIVQLLLQHPRLEIYPTLSGHTALHEAAKYHNTTILKILLQDKRFDVNAKDERGFTPLHIASYCSEEAVRALLEDSKTEVNILNQYSSTPLHIAALSGTFKTVVMLLADSRTDIFCQDIRGETALYIMKNRRAGSIARRYLNNLERG
ncbi:ankyrin repeat-containing domain protein [Tuber indicum]|nr:ankyrin repeat-containing domain protein [Tuber indicum]